MKHTNQNSRRISKATPHTAPAESTAAVETTTQDQPVVEETQPVVSTEGEGTAVVLESDPAPANVDADPVVQQDGEGTAEQPAAEQPVATEGDNAPAEQPAPEAAAPADPFADLPLITVGEAEGIQDLTDVETSNPRKYAKVADEARALRLPVLKNWKYGSAILVPGHFRGPEGGFKPTSVWGTIQSIVQRAGKAGIPAYEVVRQVRIAQIGNKRSHYCEKLPPVGWSEGWISSAIQKGVVNVHATKKAPALTVAEVAKAGTESSAEETQKAIAAA